MTRSLRRRQSVLRRRRSGLLFQYLPEVGGDLEFSRSSNATYLDENEVLQTAAAGELRNDHWVRDENGILVRSTRLEAARTNELHNSDSPETQTRSLTAGTYTLWMEGTGSVNADGATDGDYGTATEGQANDVTFTVSATQDVTFTVSGTVDRFQCEEGAFRSSFIETAGSSVSRAADSLSVPFNHVPQDLTVYGHLIMRQPTNTVVNTLMQIGQDSAVASKRLYVDTASGLRAVLYNDDGNFNVADPPGTDPSIGDRLEYRVVMHVDGKVDLEYHIDGSQAGEDLNNGSNPAPTEWDDDVVILGSNGSGNNSFADHIALLIAPGVRTMAECRSLVG